MELRIVLLLTDCLNNDVTHIMFDATVTEGLCELDSSVFET